MTKQLEFTELRKTKRYFGGSYLKNSHAKTKRPLDSKYPIHLVMRSSKAKGSSSMRNPRNFKTVNEIFHSTAKKRGLKVYRFANVGNHLLAVIKLHSIHLWAAFIRELSGKLALDLQRQR